jgi:hypothetical protein
LGVDIAGHWPIDNDGEDAQEKIPLVCVQDFKLAVNPMLRLKPVTPQMVEDVTADADVIKPFSSAALLEVNGAAIPT